MKSPTSASVFVLPFAFCLALARPVLAQNLSPTISAIADLTVAEDTPTPAIPFTVHDAETAAASLTVTATSSNQGLVPVNNIILAIVPGGGGSNRTVTVTPLPNQFGATTINLTVHDGSGATGVERFILTVSPVNDRPTLDSIGNLSFCGCVPQQTAVLTGITSGATNENQTLTVTATSSNPSVVPAPSVTYTSPNPTATLTFSPLNFTGVSTITVTVNDGGASNNIAGRTFTVTAMGDTTPPVLANSPTNITVWTSGTNTVPVFFAPPTATDNCDTNPTVTCTKNSGDQFPMGDTTVTCSATDDCDNIVRCTFTVRITETIPPTITVQPQSQTIQCGTTVAFTVTASGSPPLNYQWQFNGTSVVGETNRTYIIANAQYSSAGLYSVMIRNPAGYLASSNATLNVFDSQPPTIICPEDQRIETQQSEGARASWEVFVSDNCDPNVTLICDPPSGSLFPIGTTHVTCSARDSNGYQSTCGFDVAVVYGQPLTINQRRGVYGANTTLEWSGDGILQETRSLSPPIVWSDATLPRTRRGANWVVLLPPPTNNHFFRLSSESAKSLRVTEVMPREIDEENAPVLLTIRGHGFDPGSIVRLFYLDETLLSKDVSPSIIASNRLTVAVRADWFQALARATNGPAGSLRNPGTPPDHFALKVIDRLGNASDAAGVLVKRFPARVQHVALRNHGLLARGQTNYVGVTVERRSAQGDLPIKVSAFETPPPLTEASPRFGRLAPIAGVKGSAVLPAGRNSLLVPVWVPPGTALKDCRLSVSLQLPGSGGAVLLSSPGGSGDGTIFDPPGTPLENVPPIGAHKLQIDLLGEVQSGSPQSSVHLVWKAPLNADAYELRRRQTTGPKPNEVTVVKIFTPPFPPGWIHHTDTGLAASQTYAFSIRAWNAYGETYSIPKEVQATTSGDIGFDICILQCGSQCPPRNTLYLTIISTEDKSVGLKWFGAGCLDGSELQRKLGAGSWEVVATYPKSSSSAPKWVEYTDAELMPKSHYCYRVRNWNANGQIYSDEVCTDTKGPPPAPEIHAALGPTSDAITLTVTDFASDDYKNWFGRGDLDDPNWGYKIWFESGPLNGTTTLIDTILSDVELDTLLIPGHKYQYEIDAYNNYGISPPAHSEIVTLPGPPPDPPEPEDPPPPPANAELQFAVLPYITPTFVKAYEPFDLVWMTKNVGGKIASGFMDSLIIDFSSSLISYTPSYSLAPGQQQGVVMQFPNGLPAGDHFFVVYLDDSDVVDEIWEGNNDYQFGIQVGL